MNPVHHHCSNSRRSWSADASAATGSMSALAGRMSTVEAEQQDGSLDSSVAEQAAQISALKEFVEQLSSTLKAEYVALACVCTCLVESQCSC